MKKNGYEKENSKSMKGKTKQIQKEKEKRNSLEKTMSAQ